MRGFAICGFVRRGFLRRTRWVVFAMSLIALAQGAAGANPVILVAQTESGAGRGTTAPSQPPASDAPAALPANTPDQIKKAQIELRRLDCLRGRVDGKFGDQTRQALKKFWTSAGQPGGELMITDDLITDLAERGAGFCRPARRFFAVGFRPKGNSAAPGFIARGNRPGTVTSPGPGQAARPSSPAARFHP
jgi:peptidoglycan hydrolase-like protein with peptidoglycan-binding domain